MTDIAGTTTRGSAARQGSMMGAMSLKRPLDEAILPQPAKRRSQRKYLQEALEELLASRQPDSTWNEGEEEGREQAGLQWPRLRSSRRQSPDATGSLLSQRTAPPSERQDTSPPASRTEGTEEGTTRRPTTTNNKRNPTTTRTSSSRHSGKERYAFTMSGVFRAPIRREQRYAGPPTTTRTYRMANTSCRRGRATPYSQLRTSREYSSK